MNYSPKGSMCRQCVFNRQDCSGLVFTIMPVIEKLRFGGAIVRCTNYSQRDPVSVTQPASDEQVKTLRDEFAMAAMQGFAADPQVTFMDGLEGMAKCAYEWADAMLEARKGGEA